MSRRGCTVVSNNQAKSSFGLQLDLIARKLSVGLIYSANVNYWRRLGSRGRQSSGNGVVISSLVVRIPLMVHIVVGGGGTMCYGQACDLQRSSIWDLILLAFGCEFIYFLAISVGGLKNYETASASRVGRASGQFPPGGPVECGWFVEPKSCVRIFRGEDYGTFTTVRRAPPPHAQVCPGDLVVPAQ